MKAIFKKGYGHAVVTAVFLFALTPRNLHAYIDPGTGSMALQAVLALFFGSLLAVKVAWQRIVGFFRGTRTGSIQPDKEHSAE